MGCQADAAPTATRYALCSLAAAAAALLFCFPLRVTRSAADAFLSHARPGDGLVLAATGARTRREDLLGTPLRLRGPRVGWVGLELRCTWPSAAPYTRNPYCTLCTVPPSELMSFCGRSWSDEPRCFAVYSPAEPAMMRLQRPQRSTASRPSSEPTLQTCTMPIGWPSIRLV